MAKTQITPLTYATDDNSLLLLCADPAACARGTTDFVFDWRDPNQWGGALPVAGAPLPLRDFQNLALDKSAILVRDQQIMAPYVYGTQAHISDGKGLTSANGGTVGYALRRSGQQMNRAASPVAEGFRSFYLDVWVILRGEASQFARGISGRGQASTVEYGFGVDHTTGNVVEWVSGRILAHDRAFGTLLHLGLSLDFDVQGDTTTARTFCDGVEILGGAAYPRPSAWPDTQGYFDFVGLAGWGLAPLTLVRTSRTFTAWPGQGRLDPMDLHQDEERGRSRLLL
jgi:hypothetical protein